ncbi:MAG: hypothetical protein ABI183_04205 [Polyangiaceae bacterium]
MRGRGVKAIAALGGCLVGAVLLLDCTPEPICPAIGCYSGATIDASFPLPPSTFDGATFTLCLNGVCSSGVLAPVDGGIQMNNPQTVVLSGALGDQSVGLSVDGGGTDVGFEFGSFNSTKPYSVHDGDIYEVKIEGADASTILDVTRTATYTTPDEKCSPACHSATIRVTP